jgi:hypothetical protein
MQTVRWKAIERPTTGGFLRWDGGFGEQSYSVGDGSDRSELGPPHDAGETITGEKEGKDHEGDRTPHSELTPASLPRRAKA